MKIIHFTTVHPRNDTRIFLKECSSLVKHGHQTILFVADGKGDETIDNIVVKDIGVSFNGRIRRIIFQPLKMFVHIFKEQADVFHFHDPELIPIALFLRLIGKRVIYDAHEDVPRQILSKHWIPSYLRRIIAMSFEVLENFASKKFNAIITATDHITDRFKQTSQNSFTINNYPLLSEFPIVSHPWKNKNEEICYIGSLTRIRGIKELVLALESLESITLNLAGTFESKEFQQEVSSLNGWSKVSYIGVATRDQVQAIFSRSKVGILPFLPAPNHLNSSPNKLFEYMAAALPVVASNFPQWESFTEEFNLGVCADCQNPASIASAITKLMSSQTQAQLLGENGQKAVISKFNWESEEIKLLNIYNNICKC